LLSVQKQQAPALNVSSWNVETTALTRTWRYRVPLERSNPVEKRPPAAEIPAANGLCPEQRVAVTTATQEIDPLYLFACHVEWEHKEDPSAGWELISAAQNGHSDTRAHARSLLASSRHVTGNATITAEYTVQKKRPESLETDMKTPYDVEIVENCTDCPNASTAHFCRFSPTVLQAFNELTQKSVLPAGAILFVEGQAPRGMFILCSGRVNLSTTSREGKSLILRTAEPGEALGLSATISGLGYEVTAETSTPSLVSFIERKHYLELMETHGEVGMHTALCLSRDCRSAHRDIHNLILTRSSAGKLARLLLSQLPQSETDTDEHKRFLMTHEEIALRIGASRETVTRLLGRLRRKRLISLDGPRLVIRDRQGLQSLAV
jgi:CRP/FNR family cyclic AMP-dependent transcriptional regulator